MTRLARPLPGDRLLGRYQLVELAAEGPHSAVYRGVEIESERTVALKFDLEGRDIEARAAPPEQPQGDRASRRWLHRRWR